MEEILHHLEWLKPYKSWDNAHPWRCRILSINSISASKPPHPMFLHPIESTLDSPAFAFVLDFWAAAKKKHLYELELWATTWMTQGVRINGWKPKNKGTHKMDGENDGKPD